VLKSVDEAYAAAMAKLATPRLTRVLLDAVAQHTPPKSGLFRPKPKYAHQGGSNPPIIIIHGNHLEGISNSYKRYLENIFRTTFNLQGTPLRVEFKSGHNPFEARDVKPLDPAPGTHRATQQQAPAAVPEVGASLLAMQRLNPRRLNRSLLR
jgi:GTP-binding protein